jgi:sugar phosphate isomerase/epimerase
MGDFWHMAIEETSDLDAISSGGEFLNHIHISSRRSRYLPGTDGSAENYSDGFKGLKKIKYKGYISLVCGVSGDKNVLVPESISLLKTSGWQHNS